MMYKEFHSNSTRSFEYLGEVAIERSLDPSEVMSVYQTLNDSPDTEVLYVYPNARGTSIVCGLYDVASFLTSLTRSSKVAAWAFRCK